MQLTPDGYRYLASTQKRVARPFHLRWLLPKLCGLHERRWKAAAYGSVAAVGALTAWYSGSVWMACVVFLPGVAFNFKNPVLVDAAGMALALLSAVLLPFSWPLAMLVAFVAGCVRETSPVWAAVYAWNPLLLVGLVPVAVRWFQRQGPDVLDAENAWIIKHPIQASMKYHHGRWTDWNLMVAPWGGMLAGLAGFGPRLALALALGYSQLVVATDSVRLYQWAAPSLALACTGALPVWSLPFVAVSVVFNPWKGPGI